jgi:chemotaxis protein CheX
MPQPPIVSKTDDVTNRYGLEPMPESVQHLTRIVARQEADIEEIGKLIAKDKAITARLLRFANPLTTSEEDYGITSVEEALMRTGLAPVILLAMLEPLSRAVHKAFGMFHTPIAAVGVKDLKELAAEHVLGGVEFSGSGSGMVQVRLPPTAARLVASAIIGVSPQDLTNVAEIDDVIGELVNMIGGNLKSNLCDAGITCKLSAPIVCRTSDCRKRTVSGGVSERLGFSAGNLQVYVDVSVNPWRD